MAAEPVNRSLAWARFAIWLMVVGVLAAGVLAPRLGDQSAEDVAASLSGLRHAATTADVPTGISLVREPVRNAWEPATHQRIGPSSTSTTDAAATSEPFDDARDERAGDGSPAESDTATLDAVTAPSAVSLAELSAPRQIGPIGNPGAFPFRGTTGLADKAAARGALGTLEGTSGQLSAANRAIGRATASSSLDVGTYGQNVVIRIQRPGHDGFQVIETVVRPDGSKSVVQMAYDAMGNLVHYDPKFP